MTHPFPLPSVVDSVGFCGSRFLSGPDFTRVRSIARSVAASKVPVLAGCASGADLAARQGAGRSCRMFSVRSGRYGAGRGAHVRRSVDFVRTLAREGAPILVGFPDRPCPSGLTPSGSPRKCFAGFGSGTWASLALAVGLDVPVVVFGPFLPAWRGSWVPVRAGLFAGGFRFVPSARAPRQLSLF